MAVLMVYYILHVMQDATVMGLASMATCEQAPNGTYFCKCDEGWYGPECDVPGKVSFLMAWVNLIFHRTHIQCLVEFRALRLSE